MQLIKLILILISVYWILMFENINGPKILNMNYQ